EAVMLPIEQAMNSRDAPDKLDNAVQLYFATQPPRQIAREFGTFVANRKTNAFAKAEDVSCDWAFLAAVLELQQRALRLGGNAVVNIESYYKRRAVSSSTQFECHKGFLIAGVALRGTVVRLGGK